MFYRLEAHLDNTETIQNIRDGVVKNEIAIEFAEKSEVLFQSCGQACYLFAVSGKERKILFGAITKDIDDMEKVFWKYAENLSVQISKVKIEEITYKVWKGLLRIAERNDCIGDDVNITELFGIENLSGQTKEYMLGRVDSKEKMMETARSLLLGATLGTELERIYMGGRKGKRTGHPVHYLIRTDDRMVSERIYETLLAALFANGRIRSKRYCVLDYGNGSGGPDESHGALYQSCENGAVIVRYQGESLGEMRHSRGGEDIISGLCETALRYKNNVLTILCLPKECSKVKDLFFEKLGTTVLVELYEDVVFGGDAKNYLKLRAKECHVSVDKKLISAVEDRERGFHVTELNRIFDEWYDRKLRCTIYPQYKDVLCVKQIVKEKPKGSAFARLQELVGLSEAKKVMTQAINYYKAQKIFADRGMKTEKPSMHMVFTGNPGTAKTTVARLFAQIMKENGMLSKGDLYEVGRGDIVGQYVGQTAPLVKRAFRRARGGVLFIDEAYSLVDGEDGLYGDEAINTIVQEMENHRDDTVVIFAGYPDKMEQFLKRNPGLRSRIAFHVPFDDYSEEELCQIAELVARDKGLELSEGAITKLQDNFAVAKEYDDFGNGRYVRNLIEKAKIALANRLIEQDIDTVTDRDIVTVCAEDIESFVRAKDEMKGRRIGFMR